MSTATEQQRFDANGLPMNEAPKTVPQSQATAQSRAQWLEARKGAIGASDVAAILGISPFTTAYEVWLDKTDQIEPWKGSEATRAGQLFEPVVLDYAEAELGKLNRNVRIAHKDYPIAATLDAQVEYGGNPVEAKTTGITGRVYGDWGDAMTDQVPDYYLVQLHAQLIVTEAELGFLYALIAGRGVVRFQAERNERLNSQLCEILTKWWERHVVRGIEPPRKDMPSLEVVKRLRRTPGKSITFGPLESSLMDKRAALKEQEKQIKADLDSVDAQILLALGDAEEATLPDGTRLTYLERNRKGFVVEPTTYRQMQVIKPKGTK